MRRTLNLGSETQPLVMCSERPLPPYPLPPPAHKRSNGHLAGPQDHPFYRMASSGHTYSKRLPF
jgi:hypothetical protein